MENLINRILYVKCPDSAIPLDKTTEFIYKDNSNSSNEYIATNTFSNLSEILSILIDYGADINCTDQYCIKQAYNRGDIDVMRLLIQNGSNLIELDG